MEADVLLAGTSYAYGPFAFVRHCPAYSQILISLEGSGEVLINGEWLTCGPGMVYLTPDARRLLYKSLIY